MDIDGKVWEILCSKEEIEERIAELGARINEDYHGEKLHVISLLKGSFIFAADLVRQIKIPMKISFIRTSSYGHAEVSSGEVKIEGLFKDGIKGEHILIVDDITDSGITMSKVIEYLKGFDPKTIKTCVLLDKPDRRQVEVEADYIGFSIEDKFVVGYGLNYGEYYRNVPYVFAVTNEDRG